MPKTLPLTPMGRLRRDAGLSQAEVAADLGVSQQHIAKWERGEFLPRPAAQRQLAALYQVTAKEVFEAAEATQQMVMVTAKNIQYRE